MTVLPFGIAAVDSRLPGGGLPCGRALRRRHRSTHTQRGALVSHTAGPFLHRPSPKPA
jgi:hypothetical protein